MEHEGTLSSPSQYIEHHLSFNTQGAEASFWTLHMDTLIMSVILGMVAMGLIWMVAKKPLRVCPPKRKRLSN